MQRKLIQLLKLTLQNGEKHKTVGTWIFRGVRTIKKLSKLTVDERGLERQTDIVRKFTLR